MVFGELPWSDMFLSTLLVDGDILRDVNKTFAVSSSRDAWGVNVGNIN